MQFSTGELKSFFAGIVALLLVVGCAATQKPAPETRPAEKKPELVLNEDFDPASLGDIDFVVNPKVDDFKEQQKQQITRFDSSRVASADSATTQTVEMPGYRVQIAAITNQEDAFRVREEAMANFEHQKVYLIFEAPFYKLRVGDFDSRKQAEALQQRAIQLGYRDAWIVRTIIKKEVRR